MTNVQTWYYLEQGATRGPVGDDAMQDLVRAGAVTRDTLVWPGYGEWVPASTTALAPLFAPAAAPPPPPYQPANAGAAMYPTPSTRKDFLPKDPRMRMLVQALIVIIGLIAVFTGIRQMRSGMGELSAADKSINFEGCRGVATSAVQCAFQNTGSARQRLCLDVVVLCADGRHVASTCSDKMDPGEATNKLVNNFKPEIRAGTQCTNMTYESLHT